MKRINLTITLLTFIINVFSQNITNSNLPIVIINTDDFVEIPSDPRVFANMKIISRADGSRNYINDQNNESHLNYNGRIEIEIRGSSSQGLPKYQYGLTTLKDDNISNNNVSLLGMPDENDWILNGFAFDSSFIRDFISYNLARQMGQYAPRTKYCEVLINGDYRGIYLLQERIKADKSRVDIIKIEATDDRLPNLSGGYITKADKINEEDPSAFTMLTYLGSQVNFVHVMPKPKDVLTAQNDYIKAEFKKLENAALNKNESFHDGFPSIIDIPSFIDFMLINELSANVDGYQFSTYFHKDRNGKLRAGPLFDLNLTYGKDLGNMWGSYFDRSKHDTWQFDNGDNIGPKFWKDLFDNPTYKCYMSKRWNELIEPGNPLNYNSLTILIDQTVSQIKEAITRENNRWNTADKHKDEIAFIKTFLAERIKWMSENIGRYQECSNIETPNIIMTKINYNPAQNGSISSGDQEFIELLNNSNEIVNLSGVYIGGTGLVYQFPQNSLINPGDRIILAGNQFVFEQKFGIKPFGEFTRSLSNSGQTITFLDGFGNVIDEVTYEDELPWPDADGNGMYLEIINPDLDNDIPENWKAAIDPVAVLGFQEETDDTILFYPNPIQDEIVLSSRNIISSIHLLDLDGKLLKEINVEDKSFVYDMSSYATGIYLLRINTEVESISYKIIKQ